MDVDQPISAIVHCKSLTLSPTFSDLGLRAPGRFMCTLLTRWRCFMPAFACFFRRGSRVRILSQHELSISSPPKSATKTHHQPAAPKKFQNMCLHHVSLYHYNHSILCTYNKPIYDSTTPHVTSVVTANSNKHHYVQLTTKSRGKQNKGPRLWPSAAGNPIISSPSFPSISQS